MLPLRTLALSVATLAATVTLLTPRSASADCLSNVMCICPGSLEGVDAILTGKVYFENEGGRSRAFMRALQRTTIADGATTNFAGSFELDSLYVQGEKLLDQTRVLALQQAGTARVSVQTTIGSDDQARCSYEPSFKISSSAAVKAMRSPTCESDLRAAGMPPDGECNDTIGHCGIAKAPAAGSASTTASFGLFVLGAVAVLVRVRRRARPALQLKP